MINDMKDKENIRIKQYLLYLQEMSWFIKKFWHGYKVCEGCELVVEDSIFVCPNCKAYRFDDSKERIYQSSEQMNAEVNRVLTEAGIDSFLEEDEY
jgi:hypothetical protein